MDKETRQMFDMLLQKLDNMDKKQDEIYSVVKAIEHSNNVRKAEIDNLTHEVAHEEGTINGVGELIQDRRLVK